MLAVVAAARVLAQQGSLNSGEIEGTVVNWGPAPTAIGRVFVTVSSSALKNSVTVIADDNGHFVIRRLPPGRFVLAAQRAPYVRSEFCAKRPGRPGTPIELAAAQRVSDVRIALARGAVVTGTVRGALGDPLSGVAVTAVAIGNATAPVTVPVLTDDRGVYRAFGLPPGQYVVRATVEGRGGVPQKQYTDAQMDVVLTKLLQRSTAAPVGKPSADLPPPANSSSGLFAYAPMFAPSSADPDEAEIITLREGEERTNVDVVVQMVRVTTVTGRVTLPAEMRRGPMQLLLRRISQVPRPAGPLVATASATLEANGDYRFMGVVPGRYRVSFAMPAPSPAGILWATSDVTVTPELFVRVNLLPQPGLHMTGRLVFDAHTRAAPDPSSVRLRLDEVTGAVTLPALGAGRADGGFDVVGLQPGAFTMTSTLTDSGWWLRSAVIGGRDILDAPLDVDASTDLSGAVVTFTDRHSEVSGVLQSASAEGGSGHAVVVVTTDRSYWRSGSRRIKFARPSTDGRFVFRDLPAGEYVLAVVTDLDAEDLADAAFLDSLISAGVKLTLGEGETKTQDLKIGG